MPLRYQILWVIERIQPYERSYKGKHSKHLWMQSKRTCKLWYDSMSTNRNGRPWKYHPGLWDNEEAKIGQSEWRRKKESNSLQMAARAGVPAVRIGGWGVTWETPHGGRRTQWSHLSLNSGWNRSASLTSRRTDSSKELSANSFLTAPQPRHMPRPQTIVRRHSH